MQLTSCSFRSLCPSLVAAWLEPGGGDDFPVRHRVVARSCPGARKPCGTTRPHAGTITARHSLGGLEHPARRSVVHPWVRVLRYVRLGSGVGVCEFPAAPPDASHRFVHLPTDCCPVPSPKPLR